MYKVKINNDYSETGGERERERISVVSLIRVLAERSNACWVFAGRYYRFGEILKRGLETRCEKHRRDARKMQREYFFFFFWQHLRWLGF